MLKSKIKVAKTETATHWNTQKKIK